MDGGSTDETIPILRLLECAELSWRSEPDKGVVDAVNKGLGLAKGEILTIQSSDDMFVSGSVKAAITELQERPDLGIVYGDVEVIDEHSRLIGTHSQGPFDLAYYFGRFMYVPQPGTFFTRKALNAVGGWRSEVSYVADADFWFRIALKFPVLKLDRTMGRYRRHAEQRDKQQSQIASDWEQMIFDLIENELQDERLIRFARMGVCLARNRYADQSDWWERTKALYQAVFANPRALADPRFPRRGLLPGRDPLWRRLSRIKRKMGLPPRGA